MNSNDMPFAHGLTPENLVFTVSNPIEARAAIDALQEQGINDDAIHVRSKEADAESLHSHTAPDLVTSNVKNARVRGAIIGGIGGLILGLLFFAFGPTNILIVLALTVLGIGVGALGAQLVGVSEPDPAIAEALDAVDAGATAVIVEVAKSEHKRVVDIIHGAVPHAKITSSSLTDTVSTS